VARYLDIHPVNPQPRLIEQVVSILRDDGLIAYPTDSGYALGIQLGNRAGLDRMRSVRQLDDKHHFTLLCHDFAQMGPLVHIDNAVFRMVKAATPGPYTFILPATSEVPRRLMHPKKRTVGVRIPDHVLAHALLEALGEPLISTTLLLPGQTEPLTEGWLVKDELDQLLDAVIEGEAGSLPTTVVDFTSGSAEITRRGAGDAARFELV
jgi:tRNA threonylcarbamoyl adenosine modification protein (Sua5/YciO/YrdC/YwlC family)